MSFDFGQWNKINNNKAVIYGFTIGPSGVLLNIDSVGYYRVQASSDLVCIEKDWSNSEKPACSAGSFLAGLYRPGNRFDDVTGAAQITRALYCRISAAATWGTCHDEEPVVEGANLCSLTLPTALVGRTRSETDSGLKGLTSFRCRAFPDA